ncbi:MAG: hypothetical protein M3442_08090, partial [Chloroflexota bacterium]|nr:hypothetical protein [Chloroflexota bacterium]
PEAQNPPPPPQRRVEEGSGPAGGWSRLLAIGAVGALLLALFVAPSGSTVAVSGAVAVAGVLGTIATILFLRGRMAGAPPVADAPNRSGPSTAPPRGAGGLAGSATSGPVSPLSPPADPPHPGGTGRATAAAVPLQVGNTTQWRPPAPAAPDGDVPENVAAVCRQIAQIGVDQVAAPASSVLIRRGRRLVAGGTAGDWALARRLQAQTPGDAPVWTGGSHVNAAAGDARAGDDGQPPQFPMDDALPGRLAAYTRAIPVERWQELEDAPAEVLPLAGLADGGAGVCVPLGHSRELAGLWVLARRPEQRPYSDAELRTLENAARRAAPALAAALAAHPG